MSTTRAMNDQRSLCDQLLDMATVARDRGMYDAEDFLRRSVEDSKRRKYRSRSVCNICKVNPVALGVHACEVCE